MRLPALILLAFVCTAWTPPRWAPQAAPAEEEEDSAELGPAFGDARLTSYIDTPALKSALSELQAGRPEDALKYLPLKPRDSASRWLKALTLRAADQPRPARALFEELAARRMRA